MRPIQLSQDIRPVSEFRANTASFIQQVQESKRPLVLTQHGRGAAVLLDIEAYERLVDRVELLEEVHAAERGAAGGIPRKRESPSGA